MTDRKMETIAATLAGVLERKQAIASIVGGTLAGVLEYKRNAEPKQAEYRFVENVCDIGDYLENIGATTIMATTLEATTMELASGVERSGRGQNDWADEVDALIDARRRVAFLEEALSVVGKALKWKQRKKLRERLEAIRRRVESSELRLALVGEFNSGKTSFVNAIFREPFLKVSRRPTTAAATRIRYADRPTLEATVDGVNYVLDESNYRTLVADLRERGYDVAADASFQDLIAAITADDKIGKITSDVALGFPSPTLEKGLVLLDVPGVSAGDKEVSYHKDVAIDAIENEADATVVFLPQYASTNAAIIEFLKQHAEKYIDRAIFVLTQMDMGERDECESVERFARKIVGERLGAKDPTFYQTAAKVLLEPEKYDEDDRRYWTERFEEMENSLFPNILRLKSVVVAEKIVELMLELTSELEKALSEKKSALDEEKRLLASRRVETIRETLNPVYESEQKRLERAFERASDELRSTRGSAETRVRLGVERIINYAGADLRSQFDQTYKPKIEQAARLHVFDLTQETVRKELGKLNGEAKEAVKKIGERFQAAYNELQTLRGNVAVSSSVTLGTAGGLNIEMPEITCDLDAAGFCGAGAGALIGTLICPGIGAVLGAIAGFFGGLFAAEPPLDEVKRQLKQGLSPKYNEWANIAHDAAQKNLTDARSSVFRELSALVKKYESVYADAVEAMRKEHRKNIQKTNAEIAETENWLRKLSQRRDELQATRAALRDKR